MSQTTACINLKERFGHKYRITWEEPANSRWTDAWYQLIPCQYGHIYPHGDEILGFASDKRGGIARRVASLPYTETTQDGDYEMNIIFHVDHLDEIARIAHARKRYYLSPERKLQLETARLAFLADHPGWKPGQAIPGSRADAPERAQDAPDDS